CFTASPDPAPSAFLRGLLTAPALVVVDQDRQRLDAGEHRKLARLPASTAAQAGCNNVPRCSTLAAADNVVSRPSPITRLAVTSSSSHSLIAVPALGPSALRSSFRPSGV